MKTHLAYMVALVAAIMLSAVFTFLCVHQTKTAEGGKTAYASGESEPACRIHVTDFDHLLAALSREKYLKVICPSGGYVLFQNACCTIKVQHDEKGNVTRFDSQDRTSNKFELLRELLPRDDWESVALVHKFPSIDHDYDPSVAIAVAKRIRELGKAKAREVLMKYIDYADTLDERYELDSYKTMLVCRVLFHGRYGKHGIPGVPISSSLLAAYRTDKQSEFPLVFVSGVPFLLIDGYDTGFGHLRRHLIARDTVAHCFDQCNFGDVSASVNLAETKVHLSNYVNSERFKCYFSDRPTQFQEFTEGFLLTQMQRLLGAM